MTCSSGGCGSAPGFKESILERWNQKTVDFIQGLCYTCSLVKQVRRVKDNVGKYICDSCRAANEESPGGAPQEVPDPTSS